MADDHDTSCLSHLSLECILRLLFKCRVTHPQGFVDQNDVRAIRQCRGESKPRAHAGRVGSDGRVKKVTDFTELLNRAQRRVGVVFGKPLQQTGDYGIFAPGEVRLEPQA